MNVSLRPHVQKFVEEKISSGQYATPEDVVNSLLWQVHEQETLTPEDIQQLRDELDVGIAEADRGEFVQFTAEDIIAERHAASAARKKGG